jgi:hypothetical protein
MTDPAWEQMLIARAETHIGELYREIASMGMVTTTWQEARDMAERLGAEYAGRIVRDLLVQMNEGTRPAPDPRTVASLREYLNGEEAT